MRVSGNIGALRIRRRFCGPLYYKHKKERPPKDTIGTYLGPSSTGFRVQKGSETLNPQP